MKRIFKELKKHNGQYLKYEAIITDQRIHLKITPFKEGHHEFDSNHINNKHGKACIAWAIFKYFEHINKEQST